MDQQILYARLLNMKRKAVIHVKKNKMGKAVIAIIGTTTKDQASGHEHSMRCHCSSELLFSQKSEYSWTLVLMEIFGSTKKELPTTFPTLKTLLQLGFSKLKDRLNLQRNSLNILIANIMISHSMLLSMMKWEDQCLTSS
jgi:hypothetical protein